MVECILNICRACMTEEGEFQSVFVSEESSGLNIHLAEMLMACASIQVTFGDGLPETICKPCADKAISFFLFKVKCEESDTRLRNQLGKSPLKEEFISIPFEDDVDIIPDSEILLETSPKDVGTVEEELIMKDEMYVDTSNEILKEQIEMKENKNGEVNFYKCKFCPKVYNRSSNLVRHEKFHLKEKLYKCELCDKTFIKLELLERHKLIHVKREAEETNEKSVGDSDDVNSDVNKIADKEFDDRENQLMEERDDGDDLTELTCKICSKSFSLKSRLKRHMKTHSTEKPFTCHECFRGFSRQELYRNHMNTHTGIKPHVCSICKKGFNQISNLKDHMRTHNGEKPFLCSTCGKGFNQLGNLRQHSVRHSGIKAHICSMCGNGFASKGELSAHLRKHTGARPFVCSICHNGFTTSSSLTKHKRIHSGEKPYECDVCHMKFSRSGILSRHKRIHTGEKPYVCKYCSKAFTQSNDLNSHIRIHTGEKPYICDQCGQAFRQSSALKTHKRTHVEMKPFLQVELEEKPVLPSDGKPFLEARFDFGNNTWTYIKKCDEDS